MNGRLVKCVEFWTNELKVNSYILDVISNGYQIPFLSSPTKIFQKNNKSSLEHKDFVVSSILELLENVCIKEVQNPPFCVNPLTVSGNSLGKKRLILDLRHVNQFIQPLKVKFEGHLQALTYVKKGNLMYKFDLKSGYHHVSINKEFTKFLGFSWIIGGKRRYFIFQVLPFGISSACHLFTKLLKLLVKYWRAKGFSVVVYLDDGWGSESHLNCKWVSDKVRSDLKLARFVINSEKSIWDPCFELEWLGYHWNSEKGIITIPERKILIIKELIQDALSKKQQIPVRSIAKITGKLISLYFVLGNITPIMSRNLYSAIESETTWDSNIKLSELACEELEFWLKHLGTLPCRVLSPFWRSPERVLFTDASSFVGAGVLLHSQNQVAHCMFNQHDKLQSSTYRELKALQFALVAFSHFLAGKFVKVYSDNQNVVRITSKGRTVKSLQIIARQILISVLLKV